MIKLAIDFENPGLEWWENGGRELWDSITEGFDNNDVAVDESIAQSWLAEAARLPGWEGGPAFSPHPICRRGRNRLTRAGPWLPDDSLIRDLARRVAEQGGRLLMVGGWVRDQLADRATRDFDLEIYGLSRERISEILGPYGFTQPVGRQFPVWRNTRAGIDVALPRGEQSSQLDARPTSLDQAFRASALHRDLTLNAMAWDPLDERLIDPMEGRADLSAKRLRAVAAETFGADPLRVLRTARLSADFAADLDDDLITICRRVDATGLPVERIAGELRRILTDPSEPSRAFECLERVGQLEIFGPIAALRDVPQDIVWHPEGDVFVHTGMVIDQAALIAKTLAPFEAEVLMLAALCHDLGKPETTTVRDGRVRAIGHERIGAKRAHEWLTELRFSGRIVGAVRVLVEHHLAPAQFVNQNAGPRAYRRLARKLALGRQSPIDLERVARADHLGRTTTDARAGRFEAGTTFLDSAAAAFVAEGVRSDVVSSASIMRRGVPAGPELGRLLARCQEIQDETGWTEEDRILDRVMKDA
jgi:tRNA nucleotidyltransferase (CCA-adding enzyme)